MKVNISKKEYIIENNNYKELQNNKKNNEL